MQTDYRSRSFLLFLAALFSAIVLLVVCPAGLRAAQAAASEIVVAMRYPQEQGESHAHLYLYREDGKLLRQLTNDDDSQDRNPAFSPGGEAIIFIREKKDTKEFWSIEPRGGNLHRLEGAPGWYVKTSTSACFANLGEEINPADPPSYEAPDQSIELTLTTSKTDDDDQINGEGHGKHYKLKDQKTGKSVELGTLPGFVGLYSLLGCLEDESNHYLFTPPLRVAFFDLHLNSTDGDTTFALDLKNRRFVRLSPNSAMPVLLPGEPAFLTLTEVRYVPFGKGQRTSNSTYVERWDGSLNKVRYAEGTKAGSCYGASMYRPGEKPATVTIRDTTWKDADAPPNN